MGIPELSEIRSAEDNWAGLTDPVLRRRLQNRLNQRLYRMDSLANKWGGGHWADPEDLGRRRRAKPIADTSDTDTIPSASERSRSPTAREDPGEEDELACINPQKSSHGRATDTSPSSELSVQPPRSIHKMDQAEIQQIMAQYEASVRRDYSVGSPRVDQLLTLIQFNVFRGLVDNASVLMFSMDWVEEETISPWYTGISASQNGPCPTYLRPTPLQLEIPHHPWIDLFPFPQMRDNLLRRYDDFDEEALCNDLVDFCDVSNDETGLIVWKTPWHPSGWEVSETFLRKWGWVVEGCDDLVKSTNWWRGIRGEEPLIFNI